LPAFLLAQTGLEAQHKTIEGGVVVIHARLSINLNALTLEAVISKKRKVLLDMGSAMRVEVCSRRHLTNRHQLTPSSMR
jgi:hypothetical protein